jgi:hypothetical protein
MAPEPLAAASSLLPLVQALASEWAAKTLAVSKHWASNSDQQWCNQTVPLQQATALGLRFLALQCTATKRSHLRASLPVAQLLLGTGIT